ncbi:MAG: type IV pilus modification PilV family protein [Patescibacteria group bacterium]|jgi:hypothetical protein
MNKTKYIKGQSLFEIVVALAIVALVAVGLVRATSFSVKNTRFSTDQTKLTSLAQKRINQIIDYKNNKSKAFFDGHYLPFFSVDFPCQGSGTTCTEEPENEDYCLAITALLDNPSEIPTLAPNYASAKVVTIQVNVYWERGGSGADCGTHEYNHSINFMTKIAN